MTIEQDRKKKNSRKLPFSRTLGQIRKKGIGKTFSMLLAVLIKIFIASLRKRIKYITYKFLNKNVVVDIYGSKMWLNLRDKGISKDLFLYGKREPISTDYLITSNILKEGDVVLDIGANIGYYVLIESMLVGDSSKVYAIEPVSSNFKALESNIKLNNCKNVEIFNLAVGDKDRKSLIYVSNQSNRSAMERNLVGGDIVGVEEVDVVSVDSFLKDKHIPNLIRMDVEGYEYQIIKGMTKTLKENEKIMMELHYRFLPKEQLEEMLQILKENNFKVQFAIYEHKVNENKVVQYLLHKAGYKFPLIFINRTIDELRKLIQDCPDISPHVLFSKTIHRMRS